MIGSDAHRAVAAAIADKTVTLVKDTASNLPITPGDAQTHPAVRHLRRRGLHPRRSAGLPGHRQGRAGKRRVRGAPVQDGGPARGGGGDRRELHVGHLRGSHRRLRGQVRRRVRVRQRQGLRPGGGHPDQVVHADGRGNPLVRHRGPHRVRLAQPAQPPDRRADGEDRHPRARRARRRPSGRPSRRSRASRSSRARSTRTSSATPSTPGSDAAGFSDRRYAFGPALRGSPPRRSETAAQGGIRRENPSRRRPRRRSVWPWRRPDAWWSAAARPA